MAEAKAVVKKIEAKLVAKNPPFTILPTGQVVDAGVGSEGVPVEIDGWVQANIDNGLLIKCS